MQTPSGGARGAGCGGCGVGMGTGPVGGLGVEHSSGRSFCLGSAVSRPKSSKNAPKLIKIVQNEPEFHGFRDESAKILQICSKLIKNVQNELKFHLL